MHTDEHPYGGARPRPHAQERFAAAVEIASSGSAAFRRHARRYSLCSADADDAYQRGLEILLTKAPTADRSELRAWLHTVIKHEALAVRRQRERSLSAAEPEAELSLEREGPAEPLEERADRREQARQAADALTHLKPAELRCLLLKALGYSYEEIAGRTGYSRTKVNRCLTEGRRRFFDRFERVVSGSACAGYESLLSAAGDGETTADEERRLRAHLSACSSCRATLRRHRGAPARLAELLPPALFPPVLERGGWWARTCEALSSFWPSPGAAGRAGMVAHKLQQGFETVSAKQAAAVVASTAALAGGTAVQERAVHERAGDKAVQSATSTTADEDKGATGPWAVVPTADPPPAGGAGESEAAKSEAPAGREAPPPEPQQEFGFEEVGGARLSATGDQAATVSSRQQASESGDPDRPAAEAWGGGAASGAKGAGGGEFGP